MAIYSIKIIKWLIFPSALQIVNFSITQKKKENVFKKSITNKSLLSKRLLTIVSVILLSFSFSCADNFKDLMENEENKINNPLTHWGKIDIAVPAAAGAAMVYYDNWIYIYGGEDFFGANDNFFRYNVINNSIEILNNDDVRAYATLVEYNGELYLFGGKDENDDASDELKRYNITANTWYTFTPSDTTGSVPEARYSHIAVIYNDCLYIQGGTNDSGVVVPNIYKLDFLNSPLPGWSNQRISFSRFEHTAAVVNNELYLFGGSDGIENKNDLWKYDLTSDNFTEVLQINNIPSRSAMQMAAVSNKLYIYGGQNESVYYNDSYEYSLTSNIWTKLENGPEIRAYYSLATCNNSIYYYGGSYINSEHELIYHSDLWKYIPAN